MRNEYINGSTNAFQRKQAEFAYYRQLGAFLPTMPEAKQRRVVAAAQTNTYTNFEPYGFKPV